MSLNTSSFSELTLLKPRAATTHELELRRATWSPGTSLNASGTIVAPERLMSSPVTIDTAAGAARRRSSTRDTDVTSSAISSSTLSFFSSRIVGRVAGGGWWVLCETGVRSENAARDDDGKADSGRCTPRWTSPPIHKRGNEMIATMR